MKTWRRHRVGPSPTRARFYPYGSKSMDQAMMEMVGAVDQYAGTAR